MATYTLTRFPAQDKVQFGFTSNVSKNLGTLVVVIVCYDLQMIHIYKHFVMRHNLNVSMPGTNRKLGGSIETKSAWLAIKSIAT